MLGILVETTGHYRAVPSDNGVVPEPPAMVLVVAFEDIPSVFVLSVPAVFGVGRDQVVGIAFIVVDLSGLQPNLVYTNLPGEALHVFDLVLVVAHHQELEDDKRGFAFELFLPFHDVCCTLQYFIQPSAYTVLLVGLLGSAVNGDD